MRRKNYQPNGFRILKPGYPDTSETIIVRLLKLKVSEPLLIGQVSYKCIFFSPEVRYGDKQDLPNYFNFLLVSFRLVAYVNLVSRR